MTAVRRHLDWTVSWLEEGDNSMILRNGLTTQLWLMGAFLAYWSFRAAWSRIITDYSRDTDVILGGIGYRF